MEIPEIHIPDVHIPFTHIPNYDHSNVEVIGCTYYHRDTKNTGNRNLIIEDKNGLVTNCPYPSFNPLNYVPDQLTITEEIPNFTDEGEMPSSKPPKTEIPKDKKKDDDIVPPCPDKNDARIGTYTSEARTEKIKSYKRGSDGIECIAEYEQVTFVDSVLPSPAAALNVATISLIAASSPIIMNILRSGSKTLFKKVLSKFDKNKKDKST